MIHSMAHYFKEDYIESLILARPFKNMTLAIDNCWIANQMAAMARNGQISGYSGLE